MAEREVKTLAEIKKDEYNKERSDSYALKQAPVAITIQTRVPSKWRFVDLETGDVWMRGEDGKLIAAHDFGLMPAGQHYTNARDDPRWPAFQAWLNTANLGVITGLELDRLWRGYSASHMVVYEPKARPRQEYKQVVETNTEGKPLRSAATTHSLAIKMTELMSRLKREGFLELKFPEIRPSCYENWNQDYAIVDAAYPDDIFIGEYFDRDSYDMRFQQYLHEFFGADRDPAIIVHYRQGCQEIEVYRKKEPFDAAIPS